MVTHNLKTQSLVFKGYRKGKEAKKPADKKLYTYDEVKDLPNYGANCNDGIIDVSFDDVELGETVLDLLEKQDIYTYCINSPHGVHTYWHYNKELKDGKDIILALGVKADIHSHGTYIPLKCDGKLREETFKDNDFEFIPELPAMLIPTASKQDLWRMKEGEGRNDALSKHVFALGKAHLSEDEIQRLFLIINDSILEEPLPDNEIATILRPETFDKISTTGFYDDNGKFLPNEFGRYIIEKYNAIYTNGQLCVYDNIRGFYDSNIRIIKRLMINNLHSITMSRRNEVYDYLTIMAKDEEQCGRRYILFKNGVYDLATQQLLPHSPEYVISNQIPWDYNPNAYSELADKTLNKLSCNDPEIRTLLEECIGYTFYRDSKLGKCFVFIGEKNNGKSTFLFMLNNLLGDDNYCSVDLTNLARELDIASLANKLANIKDDISDGYMEGLNVSLFKQVCTGNRCRGKFLYNDPFDFYPYATLIFSANNIPRIKDPTGAVTKRMIIIPFNAVFTKEDPDFDPFINEKLCKPECMEYLINIGVSALQGVIMRNGFSQSKKANKEINDYKISNDSVLSFIQEVGAESIFNESSRDVYAKYEVFCSEEGSKPVRKSEMHKRIKSELGYRLSDPCRINGKITRVYVKEDLAIPEE
jgi:putative DNA primase/helicase